MTNNTNSTKKNKEALNKFNMEVASELGVDLTKGGELSSREAGSVGGSMVKKMISEYESKMK